MESTTYRPIKCKDCVRRFHSISALQQHTRYHRRVWLYQCSVCSKSFRGLEQLKRHQIVHGNEKPLECGWCSEAFLEQYQLAVHLFRQHKIVASSIGLAATPVDVCISHKELEAEDAGVSQLEVSVLVNKTREALSTDDANHIEQTGNCTDLVESVNTEFCETANTVAEDKTGHGEDKSHCEMVDQPNMDMNGNAMDSSLESETNGHENDQRDLTEREDCLYQLVDGDVMPAHAEDRDSTLTDDSADINEAIMLLTGLKDADVSSEEKSSCTALDDDQGHFTLTLMTDDSSQDSTGGVVNGSATVMMRGDPSLHHCPSREDLLGFEESVAFSEDGDLEKKPLEMSGMGPIWSASCGSLSALMMAGTAHKLSVDPGAASANASPAMSPFRATIGRGDSDSDTDTELDAFHCSDRVTADKESAISPGHTEACNDLPIQPGAITFTKTEQESDFHNFKSLSSEEKSNKSSSLRNLRLVTETLSVDCKTSCKKYIIKDKNSPEKDLRDHGKSPRKKRKRVAYKDNDFVYDYQELTAEQKEIDSKEKVLHKQPNPVKNDSEPDSSSGSSTQMHISKKRRGRPKRGVDKAITELTSLAPTSEHRNDRQTLSRFAKRKLTTKWKNAFGSDNSDRDTSWSPAPSDGSESLVTSKSSSCKDSDSGMEYKLRSNRRKNYQLFAGPGADLGAEENKPRTRSVNVRYFMENVAKVEDLRVLVTRLIMTVFPDITYPTLFQEEGLSVDYLMDEIMGAMYETQPKNMWTPFGGVGDEVKVVLCKRPQACLCHLRRKAARLLDTILPDAQEPCPTEGPGVEALIREVIQSNIKANIQ